MGGGQGPGPGGDTREIGNEARSGTERDTSAAGALPIAGLTHNRLHGLLTEELRDTLAGIVNPVQTRIGPFKDDTVDDIAALSVHRQDPYNFVSYASEKLGREFKQAHVGSMIEALKGIPDRMAAKNEAEPENWKDVLKDLEDIRDGNTEKFDAEKALRNINWFKANWSDLGEPGNFPDYRAIQAVVAAGNDELSDKIIAVQVAVQVLNREAHHLHDLERILDDFENKQSRLGDLSVKLPDGERLVIVEDDAASRQGLKNIIAAYRDLQADVIRIPGAQRHRGNTPVIAVETPQVYASVDDATSFADAQAATPDLTQEQWASQFAIIDIDEVDPAIRAELESTLEVLQVKQALDPDIEFTLSFGQKEPTTKELIEKQWNREMVRVNLGLLPDEFKDGLREDVARQLSRFGDDVKPEKVDNKKLAAAARGIMNRVKDHVFATIKFIRQDVPRLVSEIDADPQHDFAHIKPQLDYLLENDQLFFSDGALGLEIPRELKEPEYDPNSNTIVDPGELATLYQLYQAEFTQTTTKVAENDVILLFPGLPKSTRVNIGPNVDARWEHPHPHELPKDHNEPFWSYLASAADATVSMVLINAKVAEWYAKDPAPTAETIEIRRYENGDLELYNTENEERVSLVAQVAVEDGIVFRYTPSNPNLDIMDEQFQALFREQNPQVPKEFTNEEVAAYINGNLDPALAALHPELYRQPEEATA